LLTLVFPATQEEDIGRIVVLGQLGQKVNKTTISTNKLGMVPATWAVTGRWITIQASTGQKCQTLSEK
jgi:hypothetical protein